MGLFRKIKELFVKPNYHPEAHDEKVAKIIDEVCKNGLRKGLKRSEIELVGITGMEKDDFKKMLESSITMLNKPGEYQTVAMMSDRINLDFDDEKKARLRLPEDALNALAVIALLENLGKADREEVAHGLRSIFAYHYFLPSHPEQVDMLIKEISEKGLKKGSKKMEAQVGYLTRMSPSDFSKTVEPKVKAFIATAYDSLVPQTTDLLGMNLNNDEKKRFRLKEDAMEAFVALKELKTMTEITESEERNALKEIFRHYFYLPTHEEQVAALIEKICNVGFEKGVDKMESEIKYLADMTATKFKNDARLSVKMTKERDLSELMSNADTFIGKLLDEDQKQRIFLKDGALEALGVLEYMDDSGFLRGNEKKMAMFEIFKHHDFKEKPTEKDPYKD